MANVGTFSKNLTYLRDQRYTLYTIYRDSRIPLTIPLREVCHGAN